MDNRELQRLVEEISISCFSTPFLHQVTCNPRLKTTGGRYHLASHHLDFNPLLLTYYGKEELIKVIKHELCHYHLHLQGKGYQHKDRSFKELLSAVGGSRFAPPMKKSKQEIYQCTGCGDKIVRKRKFNESKYCCRRCRSRFKHLETITLPKQ